MRRRQAAPAEPGFLQVVGALAEDAALTVQPTPPHAGFLRLRVRAELGDDYIAHQPLGTNPATHIAARDLSARLRRGARVALYAQGVQPRTDHGHAVNTLLNVQRVVLLEDRA